MNCWRAQRGMTLIETTVVMLVIGISMTMAIPAVTNITAANLRASARKVSGSIRYGYDLAARKNATFRMVFDLDKGAYWFESANAKFLMDKEKMEVSDGALDLDSNSRSKRFVTRSFIENDQMWKPKAAPAFSKFAGPMSKPVLLPDGVVFRSVWVAHQESEVQTGQAYLYCFPSGMTERAVVHLMDEDENIYTLWVHALTGRVKVFPEYREAPDE